MGEITELVLEGIICCECGSAIDGTAVSYPRKCDDCRNGEDDE